MVSYTMPAACKSIVYIQMTFIVYEWEYRTLPKEREVVPGTTSELVANVMYQLCIPTETLTVDTQVDAKCYELARDLFNLT